MEAWMVGFLKDYGAMATVIAATLALGIPALVRLGTITQRLTPVEQRLGSIEMDIRTEIRPAITQLREGLSGVEREVAVQSERINSFSERMATGFTHLRELIDKRLPKRR
jgi:hypothetical protein